MSEATLLGYECMRAFLWKLAEIAAGVFVGVCVALAMMVVAAALTRATQGVVATVVGHPFLENEDDLVDVTFLVMFLVAVPTAYLSGMAVRRRVRHYAAI